MDKKRAYGPPPLTAVLGGGESVYFKDVAPSRLIILQWMVTYPLVYEPYKLGLVDYNNNNKNDLNWGGGCRRLIKEELERGLKYIVFVCDILQE